MNKKIFLIAALVVGIFSGQLEGSVVTSIKGIEDSPLILSNHDSNSNSLQESVYELLEKAQFSIVIFSFTFSDQKVIQLINQKASEGLRVQLILDRDHLRDTQGKLHASIKVDTRNRGEGHVHHKILIVDQSYVWLGSGNFTKGSFVASKNLALGFFSPTIAELLYQEAFGVIGSKERVSADFFSTQYDSQRLELYVLPHNEPNSPQAIETQMNENGKRKLIALIDDAQHHIKASVDVWTFKDASRAIIDAMERGVQIDLTVGDMMSDAVRMLTQEGIKVKQGKNIHYKFMVIDHEILLHGSPNWSMNAFSRSDESFIVLYNITKEQLKALEGPLLAAELPLNLYYNNKVNQVVEKCEFSGPLVQQAIQQVQNTVTSLQHEISKVPVSAEHKRLIAIGTRLSADLVRFIPYLKTEHVPGCCLYQGDNYLTNVVAIAEKQARVEAAIKYIRKADNVDQKVCDYFKRTLHKLRAGINAPLPNYFHATRAGLESIIASKTIVQSSYGATGPGTYISCNNEGNHGYGTHTFAIDEGCLVDTMASFRTGRHPVTNVYFSLWASVLKNISLSSANIAFIDTSVADVSYVQALLAKQNLNIEVVDRDTAESILHIFDKTTPRRELPSFSWTKFNTNDYLPDNLYLRSEQGTLQDFRFKI